MSMPASVPAWNTGAANRTEPSAGKKILGWVVGEPVDSSYFNWWMNLVYQWVLFLQGIQTEALTWTALETFNAGIVATKGGTAGGDSAITATGPGGVAAIAVSGTAGAGVGSIGVYGLSTAVSGIGVSGAGTARGVYGLSIAGIGVVGVSGVTGIAGQGGSGAGGSFTSNINAGVITVGGTNMPGLDSTGDGTAAGATLTGGASGGHGVIAIGGAGGGIGGVFTGTLGAGLQATGDAGSTGVIGIGGAGAYGVSAESPDHVALRATRSDSTSLSVIDSRGAVDFDNATAPATNAPLSNKLTRDSFAKAWALIEFNATVSPTLLDGLNVGTITQDVAGGGDGDVTIELITPMANTNYAVKTHFQNVLGGDMPDARPSARTASQVTLTTFTTNGIVPVTSGGLNTYVLFVEFFGAQ